MNAKQGKMMVELKQLYISYHYKKEITLKQFLDGKSKLGNRFRKA